MSRFGYNRAGNKIDAAAMAITPKIVPPAIIFYLKLPFIIDKMSWSLSPVNNDRLLLYAGKNSCSRVTTILRL